VDFGLKLPDFFVAIFEKNKKIKDIFSEKLPEFSGGVPKIARIFPVFYFRWHKLS
jgi:hypothetical protein